VIEPFGGDEMATLTLKSRAAYATREQWNGKGEFPNAQVIEPGTVLEYLGHTPGGMVYVWHAGQEVVIHPGATKELGT
jgi:hypothetical protein